MKRLAGCTLPRALGMVRFCLLSRPNQAVGTIKSFRHGSMSSIDRFGQRAEGLPDRTCSNPSRRHLLYLQKKKKFLLNYSVQTIWVQIEPLEINVWDLKGTTFIVQHKMLDEAHSKREQNSINWRKCRIEPGVYLLWLHCVGLHTKHLLHDYFPISRLLPTLEQSA